MPGSQSSTRPFRVTRARTASPTLSATARASPRPQRYRSPSPVASPSTTWWRAPAADGGTLGATGNGVGPGGGGPDGSGPASDAAYQSTGGNGGVGVAGSVWGTANSYAAGGGGGGLHATYVQPWRGGAAGDSSAGA